MRYLLILLVCCSWIYAVEKEQRKFTVSEIEKDTKTLVNIKNVAEKEEMKQNLQKKYLDQFVTGSFLCREMVIGKGKNGGIHVTWIAGDFQVRKFILTLSEDITIEEGKKINKGDTKQLTKTIGKITFNQYGTSIKIKQEEKND